jgi:hypothetical protein
MPVVMLVHTGWATAQSFATKYAAWQYRSLSNCPTMNFHSSSAEVTGCMHCLQCPGTAKAGGGDFVCGKCAGSSANGRQRYSSKAGATSCSLCPVGGRVNGARTTCSASCLFDAAVAQLLQTCNTNS